MEKIFIVVIEDQREVLQAISKDLVSLEGTFVIEECESTKEAKEIFEEIENEGDYLALVISDHVMPEETGVELLSKLNTDNRFNGTKKILLTGLATHQDTITAINKASIDKYIGKPWKTADLLDAVKSLVTEYILERGIEYSNYVDYIDKKILFERLRKSGDQ